MEMPKVVCPNCGSDDITHDEDGFFCEDCFNAFQIQDTTPPDEIDFDGETEEIL